MSKVSTKQVYNAIKKRLELDRISYMSHTFQKRRLNLQMIL